MKFASPLIAVFVAALSLSACGGGGGGSSSSIPVSSPAALSVTDGVVGSGATATSGTTATVTYTGWLYNASASDFKGKQFDSGSFFFKLGTNAVVPGFEQAVLGMKVGGTRTVLVPSNLGYGASGANGIPANSGLVFEIKLTSVQ